MNRYQVLDNDCGEIETKIIRAEDFNHLDEKFWDWIGDNNGGDHTSRVEIISITRL